MKAPTTTTNRCAAVATAVLLGLMVLSTKTVDCVELTFELMDNAKDCFYEEILKNTSVLLEYQVRGAFTQWCGWQISICLHTHIAYMILSNLTAQEIGSFIYILKVNTIAGSLNLIPLFTICMVCRQVSFSKNIDDVGQIINEPPFGRNESVCICVLGLSHTHETLSLKV